MAHTIYCQKYWLIHPNLWIQVFQSLLWPQVYKANKSRQSWWVFSESIWSWGNAQEHFCGSAWAREHWRPVQKFDPEDELGWKTLQAATHRLSIANRPLWRAKTSEASPVSRQHHFCQARQLQGLVLSYCCSDEASVLDCHSDKEESGICTKNNREGM